MNACYDLSRCPPTFDAVTYLALLDLERKRRDEEYVDLHILPGPAGGFRRDVLWPKTHEERVAMRDNVLVPLCALLPSVMSCTVRRDRAVEGWGKNEYHISLPGIMRALREGSRPLRADGEFEHKSGRPLITMTLREAEHHPLRNSRTDEWALAAEELQARGYQVVIIRDARLADTPLVGDRVSGVQQVDDAARDIALRARWYAAAALNVGVSNGPMWMAIFMDVPVLMLRPTTNAAGACYDDQFHRRWGLERGAQLPTSPRHQRLVWGDDDSCGAIVRAVEDMMEAIA